MRCAWYMNTPMLQHVQIYEDWVVVNDKGNSNPQHHDNVVDDNRQGKYIVRYRKTLD